MTWLDTWRASRRPAITTEIRCMALLDRGVQKAGMKRDGGTIIIRSILVIAVLLSAPDRASGQQQAHREAIDKTYRRWVDAANAKDLDRWVTFLAPDPIFLPPGHPALHGAKAIRDYYELLFTDDRFALDCRQEWVKLTTRCSSVDRLTANLYA